MLSRNDLDLSGRYPEVRDALAAQSRRRFAVDGEIVAFDARADELRPARPARPPRGRRSSTTSSTCCGSTASTSARCRLRTRKRLLRDTLSTGGRLRLSTHRNEAGEAMFAHACRQGWEGVVAKRADSPYRETPLARLAEVQVRGRPGAGDRRLHRAPREPHGARRAAARLLRATGSCATPARSGPALTARRSRTWGGGCERCAARASPFARPRDRSASAGITWVTPQLVAQVGVHRVDRAPGGCAIPGTWACARTRPPSRWCAKHE